jgi:hypothetical protein
MGNTHSNTKKIMGNIIDHTGNTAILTTLHSLLLMLFYKPNGAIVSDQF